MILVASAVAIFLIGKLSAQVHTRVTAPAPVPTQAYTKPALVSPPPEETPTPTATPVSEFAPPVNDFKARSTKKLFGTYVTPQDSPTQPEKFTGYHTGVDVEFTDTTDDIPVYAIAEGTVRRANYTSGYGGLLVIEHTIHGEHFFSLYGHLRTNTLPRVGTIVKKGDPVGVLGTGNSQETDGERHHLHFGIITSSTFDVRGYTTSTDELHRIWKDPLSLYP
jgi:murein DD-endopeptidase MepM/ murein hydrolase activator NlpD